MKCEVAQVKRMRPLARRTGRAAKPLPTGRPLLMTRLTETLARIGLFASLDAKAIGQLDTRCAWRRATSGQWLIDYQDASSDVFFVVSGSVRVMIQSAGREVLLRQINAGEFFGELAAIDGQPRSSGIVAM